MINITTSKLWILTEERPKKRVIKEILKIFSSDNGFPCFIDTIRILPILDKDRKFSFLYEVIGFRSNRIEKIFLKIVSGYSSFVDHLIFYQDSEPNEGDIPLYAIEETKTDDAESRNTGVFQRCSKFVYLDHYYKKINKIMLYNLSISQKEEPTDTYILGTRCLLTLGVKILGKELNAQIFKPFKNINELIKFKDNMKSPPKGNIPILIKQENNVIKISGRLFKSGNLSHDPNIGALSLLSATLRKLGWKKNIIITDHALGQHHLKPKNKFIKIANMLNLNLDNLSIPESVNNNKYWKYESEGEKLGSIFIHLVIENFTGGNVIFENHAGCEKGYFYTKEGKPIQLEKFTDRFAYKQGDKSKVINIPDLIVIDFGKNEVINVEGKKYEERHKGIKELNLFKPIEDLYIKKYYPGYKIIRTVVLYGGIETEVFEIEVGFLLNKKGDLILGIKAPDIFKESIKNLIDFWFN